MTSIFNQFLFVCCLRFSSGAAYAASDVDELRLYYIMKDAYTIAGPLDQAIRKAYEEAIGNPHIKTVFFLPNTGQDPSIITVNLPNDNRVEFEGLISTLHQGNHQVNATRDVDALIDLFSKQDFLLPSGTPRYGSIQLYFFTCASFDIGAGFIPRIWFALDLNQIPGRQAHLTILRPEGDENVEEWESSFDRWGICPAYQIATY